MAKLTVIQNYEGLIEVIKDTHPEYVPFLEHQIELTRKKNSRANSKTARENNVIADMVKDQLKVIGRPVTITELMQESKVISDYICENGRPLTNQKLTSIMTKLVDNKELAKTIDKRKSYYSAI